MRTLLALALVLAACGPADRPAQSAAHDAPSSAQTPGTDPLVLRVPRTGGQARVYAYPAVDSLLWRAPGAPRIARVLGFNPDEGVIAFVDQADVPGRIDLRMGDVSRAGSRFTLTSAGSADGSAIFGVSGGKAVRFTPTARWELSDHAPAIGAVFPQGDGSVVAMSRPRGGSVGLWRIFPPNEDILDSATVEGVIDGPRLQTSDRLYLPTATGFAVVRSRGLEPEEAVRLAGPPRDAVATPSGDRLYVIVEGDTALAVYERFRGSLGDPTVLPGTPRSLRMDPLGRYLLVRPESGDSAWVVAVGTSRIVGAVRTSWREDLPFVAPDGAIAAAQGRDVVFLDGATLRQLRRVVGGAADYWYPFQWNGFRPRAAGLDSPVEFEVGVSDTAADSALAAAAAAADSAPPPSTPPVAEAPPSREQWTVSFAALLVEESARRLAAEITVDGQRARVETTLREGVPVHRVVLGPFPSRAAAERVGRQASRPYWVYAAAGT